MKMTEDKQDVIVGSILWLMFVLAILIGFAVKIRG